MECQKVRVQETHTSTKKRKQLHGNQRYCQSCRQVGQEVDWVIVKDVGTGDVSHIWPRPFDYAARLGVHTCKLQGSPKKGVQEGSEEACQRANQDDKPLGSSRLQPARTHEQGHADIVHNANEGPAKATEQQALQRDAPIGASGHPFKGGDEEGVPPGQHAAKFWSPRVPTALCQCAEHSHGENGALPAIAQVNQLLVHATLEHVQQRKLCGNATIAEDLDPVALPSFFMVRFKLLLHLRPKLRCSRRRYKESKQARQEDIAA